jgi:hypothetical protein
LLRATYQNAVLVAVAACLTLVAFVYREVSVELWVAASLLIAAAIVNLGRVIRANGRMTHP